MKINNSTSHVLNNNMCCFLSLLKNSKIEDALIKYFHQDILIIYNNKERLINKQNWIRYVKNNILNKFTNIIQFNISNVKTVNGYIYYNIFMICKKHNGRLDFTKIQVTQKWKNDLIYQTKYNLHSY